jgi:hypothetical protein
MKTTPYAISTLTALALAVLPASAATYTDATGDFTGGFGGLDITSVNLNNDATSLNFTINLAGDPTPYNWMNYLVGISKNLFGGVGGDANATGGWGTDIKMSSGGMDYFIGAYPGFAGYSLKTWDGVSAWTSTSGTSSETTSSVSFSAPLASLGLSPGDTIKFDVWTQSSGNSVLDALSDNVSRGFQNNPFDTGANALSYTVTAAPEPGTCALLGLGVLSVLPRVLRRNAR